MAQATVKQTEDTVINLNTNDPAAKAGLDVKKFTNAPLKMMGEFEFNCAPERLWPLVTDAHGIASWFPIIYGGSHDYSSSQTKGSCGIGAKRYCKSAMGTINETFLHWEEPKVYAYSAKNFMMPTKNHVAVMILEQIAPGKTRLTWLQYFDYKGLVMRHMFPYMMTTLINMGINKLAKMVGGGKGGKMRVV